MNAKNKADQQRKERLTQRRLDAAAQPSIRHGFGLTPFGINNKMSKDGPATRATLEYIGRKKPTHKELCMKFGCSAASIDRRLKQCGDRVQLDGDRYELVEPSPSVEVRS